MRAVWKTIRHWFLFGNWLYGVAAALLAVATSLQLNIPLLPFSFYAMLCLATVAFYSFSYSYDRAPDDNNIRAVWIFQNRKPIIALQWIYLIIAFILGIRLLNTLPAIPIHGQIKYFALLGIAPCIAVLYYGVSYPGIFKFNLRQIGWLKPFTISVVWIGSVNFTPMVINSWMHQLPLQSMHVAPEFLLHNLMYIAVLCILFDIKDYAADHNQQLKTFVVRVGYRRTVFSIVLPLVLIGITALIFFLILNQYTWLAIFFNLLPMFLLLWVIFKMHLRRSIEFYLLVIDGLMIVKACCGITAVLVS